MTWGYIATDKNFDTDRKGTVRFHYGAIIDPVKTLENLECE